MPIAVGDNVKTKDDKPEYGRVTLVSGNDITYKTGMGAVHVTKSTNLEAAHGFNARLSQFGPDLQELIGNSAVFAVLNYAFKKKLGSQENMKFVVQDGLYEFLLKGMARDWEDKIWTRTTVAQKDIDEWFASQDLTDALSKATTIAVMEVVYRLVAKKGALTMGTLVYVMKVVTALYISNLGSRKLMGKKAGDPYLPQ